MLAVGLCPSRQETLEADEEGGGSVIAVVQQYEWGGRIKLPLSGGYEV